MCELIVLLTNAERLQLDLAAAALGKTYEQMVADELQLRYSLLDRISDVVVLPTKNRGKIDGHH